MCVRKPLSRFRQLKKIDHRNPERGSSQVTAAVCYTADNKTTARENAGLLLVIVFVDDSHL